MRKLPKIAIRAATMKSMSSTIIAVPGMASNTDRQIAEATRIKKIITRIFSIIANLTNQPRP